MKNEQKTLLVYDSWSLSEAKLMGNLNVQNSRGEDVFSFSYNEIWLKESPRFVLDPDLEFYAGKQYLLNGKKQFGIFMDSEPDRWGRTLLKRRESLLAAKEKRKVRPLAELDYLLGVDDLTRVGGIRFKENEDGPFLAAPNEYSVPPLKRLRELEASSLEYEEDNALAGEEWMKILIGPGSSLGGARPKANVMDVDGSLWIAKFPSRHDEYDAGAWEYVVHELAKLCSISVPEAKLMKLSDNGSTFLTKRFDRKGDRRIHFASAMTMLGKQDGESLDVNYTDIADFLRANGAQAKEDIRELWKRIVFSVLVKNTDDHLRNHGFLLSKDGWALSPMYDVNPNPDGTHLSLGIERGNNSLDADYLIEVSPMFFFGKDEAKFFLEKAREIISRNWVSLAKKNGIKENSIKAMETAFVK